MSSDLSGDSHRRTRSTGGYYGQRRLRRPGQIAFLATFAAVLTLLLVLHPGGHHTRRVQPPAITQIEREVKLTTGKNITPTTLLQAAGEMASTLPLSPDLAELELIKALGDRGDDVTGDQSCPGGPNRTGRTFTCTATVNGHRSRVRVTIAADHLSVKIDAITRAG